MPSTEWTRHRNGSWVIRDGNTQFERAELEPERLTAAIEIAGSEGKGTNIVIHAEDGQMMHVVERVCQSPWKQWMTLPTFDFLLDEKEIGWTDGAKLFDGINGMDYQLHNKGGLFSWHRHLICDALSLKETAFGGKASFESCSLAFSLCATVALLYIASEDKR